jgi:hypothetical protein
MGAAETFFVEGGGARARDIADVVFRLYCFSLHDPIDA